MIDDGRVQELTALFRLAHEEIESSQFAVIQISATGGGWQWLRRLKSHRKTVCVGDASGRDPARGRRNVLKRDQL